MTFPRCTATTAAGRPCTNRAKHEDACCTQHSATAEAREEQRRRLAGTPSKIADHGRHLDDPAGMAIAHGVTDRHTPDQQRLFRASLESDRVAVAAGNRTGRTAAFAWRANHHCLTNANALALISTPSASNLRGTLYRSICAQLRTAKIPAEIHLLPIHGVEFPNGSRIIGVASNDGPKLQGHTAEGPILVIIDEGFGYTADLWDALLSNVAGGGSVLVGGNPLTNIGPLAEIFVKEKPGWTRLHFSSLDAAKSGIKGLATEKWCTARLEEYGAESILYRGRVLGLLSDQNATGLLSMFEIMQAQQRHDALPPRAFHDAPERLVIAVDVARTGFDHSVGQPVRGSIARAPEIWKIPDLVEVADRVLALARDLRRDGEEDPEIRVDGIGIGAGVVDILKRAPGIRVTEIQAAASASRDAYANVRAEAAFACRDWVRAGGCIPRDPRLERELATIQYEFDAKNRLRIRSKDELKKLLGGASTDVFDALAMAVYSPQQRTTMDQWSSVFEELSDPAGGIAFGVHRSFWRP